MARSVESEADAPDAGTLNATCAPATGLLEASVTRATSGAPYAVATVAVCGVPETTAICVAWPAVFVSENEAGAETPGADALTLYCPAMPFAVAVTLARPEAFVVAGEPAMAAEAPEPGGVKVTETPATGLPLPSFTIATSAAPNAVLTVVLWPPPALAVMVVAAPAVLVSEKLAGAETPTAEAATA